MIKRPFEWLYAHLKWLRLEGLFAVIFLVFGALFIIMTPPGWNTDEYDHSFRAYQLSTGNLLSEQVVTPGTGLKAYGGSVPTNLLKLYDETGAALPGAPGDVTTKVDTIYKDHPDVLTLKDDGSRSEINFSGAALYSPVAYITSIPAFWLGKLLSLPFFTIIIIARILGMLLAGLFFYLAIKYIPIGKWIVFAVALLPGVVVQAASLGTDALQAGLVFLFLALVLRLVYSPREPRVRNYAVLAGLGIALTLVKMVYAPIVLLVLALPFLKKEYRTRRHIILGLATIVVAIIPGLIWMHMVGYIDINSNPQANIHLQESYILQHPLVYLKTLYYTLFTNQQAALGGIFGNFVWESAPLPAFYTYLASGAIIVSLFVKSKRETIRSVAMNMSNHLRITLAVVSAIIVALVSTALYVYSTTLHQSSVVGLQARYFIPVLPVLLLIFYGNVLKNQKLAKVGIVLLLVVVLIGALLTVYQRLYQTLPLILS